jgi:hypothetical protein
MAREIVNTRKLVKIPNEELGKYPEAAACEFTMIDFKLLPHGRGLRRESATLY